MDKLICILLKKGLGIIIYTSTARISDKKEVQIMIIGLRGDHSPNCVGTVGIANEYRQMQEFSKHISKVLTLYGNAIIDCNSNSSTANTELSEVLQKLIMQMLICLYFCI